MFVYNILMMETPNTSYNGKLLFIPNPDIDDNWIKRFTDGWKNLNNTLGFSSNAPNIKSNVTPLYKDNCNDKDYDAVFVANTSSSDKEIALSLALIAVDKKVNTSYSSNIEQSDWLNNKKHILVITLPSNFLSILKILKINKEQYFTLYKDKWSLKEKSFDAVVVDSSMPYHLEFYNSIKKYIKYKVPIYLLEKEALKTIK